MDNAKALYWKLSKIEDRIYRVVEIFGAILMAAAFISVFVQVLYRYILCKFWNLPLSFTEELARYCFFWIVYLLLPDIIKAGMEASNTFLPERMKGKAKATLFVVVRTICVVIATISFIYSFKALNTYWNFKSPVMQLPGFFMYGPVVIGLGMVVLHYLIEMIGFISGEVRPFDNISVGGAE